ncbi:hypothetical protein GCM10023331_38760 [Algivirga pacifica]|uniref:Uncharacterized protein n=1 Tax=Algivirga pacifica TaxID=1162670 RepID=A0ABP9DPD1_9BACT
MFWGLSAFVAHPIHISVTDMRYNKENKTLELIHKVFIDDLEAAVVQSGGPNLRLNTQYEHENSAQWVYDYIEQNFTVLVNGDPKSSTYIGHEFADNSISIYREVEKVKRVRTIDIEANIFTKVFPDQKNMVHLVFEDFKESKMGTTEEPAVSFLIK